MGKKSKFKKISRLAAQMPVIETKKVVGERVTGSEVIKAGIKEVDGKEVVKDHGYRKKTVIATPINHKRQMKKLYNKHGAAGVGSYLNAVQQYTLRQNQNQPSK